MLTWRNIKLAGFPDTCWQCVVWLHSRVSPGCTFFVFFTADSKSSAPSYKFCIKCLFVAASLQQLLRELPANIQQLFTLINTMTEDLLLMVNMSTGNSNRYSTSCCVQMNITNFVKHCDKFFVVWASCKFGKCFVAWWSFSLTSSQ